jgi:hypothetical protein
MRLKHPLLAFALIVAFASLGYAQAPKTHQDRDTADFRVEVSQPTRSATASNKCNYSRNERRSWGCKSSNPKLLDLFAAVSGEPEKEALATLCGGLLSFAELGLISRRSDDLRPSPCVGPCCHLLLLVASKGQEKGNVNRAAHSIPLTLPGAQTASSRLEYASSAKPS